jgi:hypothetical protein
VDDAEAPPQRRGEKARPCRGPDQGEGLQGDLHGAGAGPAADHEVEAVVLEGGVEDLLDLGVEPVDLVHEEDLAVLERGEEGGEVSRALDHGPRGGLDRHPELVRDDVSEARLAHPGGAEEKHVVDGLAPRARRLDGHPEVGDHLGLADVLLEAAGPEGRPRSRDRRRSGGR